MQSRPVRQIALRHPAEAHPQIEQLRGPTFERTSILMAVRDPDSKAVLVFDLVEGKLLQRIEGIELPHAVWYREDTDRLYVTDGGDGSVEVYDANKI
jgi:hypothetical protein